jgi:tRNA-dihydrouridine synthase B
LIARAAEAAGAAAVDVHARSVAQAYVGDPDWRVVHRVKQTVGIPVWGSGGIRRPADALRFLDETGADAVAIGRGCLGNPWIFEQARTMWLRIPGSRQPTRCQRGQAALKLVEGEFQLYGHRLALRRLPRTSCYFAKFLPEFHAYRDAVKQVRDLQGFRRLVKEFYG